MTRSGRFNHEMLRRIRQELSLTQEEAARLVGTDVRTWRRYESGAVNARGFAIRTAKRRKLLVTLCAELGVDAPEDWLVTTPPPLGHALPPVSRFVGRQAELTRLSVWLAEGVGVIAVTGIGGMGKTALVSQLIADRPAFVWSLYADPRVERLLAALLAHLGAKALPGQVEDALLARIETHPTLIVLDGLEVVQSHGSSAAAMGELTAPSLRRLLRRMARGGAGIAVVTSRLPLSDIEGAARHLPLPLLSEVDTTALLMAQGLTDVAARQAATVSGGHALSAAMVGAYVREFLDGDPAGLSAIPLEDAAEDAPLARRLLSVLSATAATLSPAERDLMARAALFPGGLTLEILRWLATRPELAGSLSGLGEAALRRLLSRLSRRGLLFSTVPGQWSSHPFVRESFRRMPGVPQAAIVAALSDGARLDRHHTAASPDERDRDEALLHTLLAADQPDAALQLYQRALGGFGALGLQAGEWMRGLRLLSAFSTSGAPDHLHPRLTPGQRTALAYDWGLFAGALGDLPQAMRCYRACLTFAAPLEPSARQRYQATAHRTLAYTLRLAGRFEVGLDHIHRSLAASSERWHQLRGIALHAALLHDRGEHDAAARRYAEAEAALGRHPTARWGLWLAEHLWDTGQHHAARILTRANLHHCAQQGWRGHVAHCHLTLGLMLPTERAQASLEAGRQWVDRTGEVELRLCARRLSAAIAASQGDRRPARSGRDAAADLGFGWFVPRFEALVVSCG
ncbi:MAG: transcriptional regulator with XRE-family HTH domain/tetratricopeptide (TPR) repeat protein [Myxococcota bacterium]